MICKSPRPGSGLPQLPRLQRLRVQNDSVPSCRQLKMARTPSHQLSGLGAALATCALGAVQNYAPALERSQSERD